MQRSCNFRNLHVTHTPARHCRAPPFAARKIGRHPHAVFPPQCDHTQQPASASPRREGSARVRAWKARCAVRDRPSSRQSASRPRVRAREQSLPAFWLVGCWCQRFWTILVGMSRVTLHAAHNIMHHVYPHNQCLCCLLDSYRWHTHACMLY